MIFIDTQKNNQGFVLFTSIIILGAILSAILTVVVLSGTTVSQTSFIAQQSRYGRALTEACVEQALQNIRDNTAYSGSDMLLFGNHACTYTVIDQGGENRLIQAESVIDMTYQRIEVVVDDIEPLISIVSWDDVAIFSQ